MFSAVRMLLYIPAFTKSTLTLPQKGNTKLARPAAECAGEKLRMQQALT